MFEQLTNCCSKRNELLVKQKGDFPIINNGENYLYTTIAHFNLQVLHGDLAARNILLANDGVVKVADYGMARKIYYQSKKETKRQVDQLIIVTGFCSRPLLSFQGLMPIKWMAIESLMDDIFSPARALAAVRLRKITLAF